MTHPALSKPRSGFTLVEIMIVVAIIALLAAIAVPNFLRARKRSQATDILQDLRILNDAVSQYTIDNNKYAGQSYGWLDLQPYVKVDSRLYDAFATDGSRVGDLFNNAYCTTGVIDQEDPNCGDVCVNLRTYDALSDVAPTTFWSPYGVQP
ncbi:MAG TPA: prepilin-type N-terminal cleavage/methylation domain-containing protein [Chthoniobacteraceae bacterium]|nr:prepilin-type N-terminal cleavage/methylation domain-containing protein [Chthoniobacteraceae bacterium]